MGKFDASAAIKEAATIKSYKPMIALANNQLDYIIGLSDLVNFNEVEGGFPVYFLNRMYRINLNFKKMLNNNGLSYTTKDYVYIKYVDIIDEFIESIQTETKKIYRLSNEEGKELKLLLIDKINKLLDDRLLFDSLMESHVAYVKNFVELHKDDLEKVSVEKFASSVLELETFLSVNSKAVSSYSYIGELVSDHDMAASAEAKAKFDPTVNGKKVVRPTELELDFTPASKS